MVHGAGAGPPLSSPDHKGKAGGSVPPNKRVTRHLQACPFSTVSRTYRPEAAVVMDRFVHRLSGARREQVDGRKGDLGRPQVVRRSTESAVTMKEIGMTIEM